MSILKWIGKDAADVAGMNEETEIEEFLKSKRSSPLKDSDIWSTQWTEVERGVRLIEEDVVNLSHILETYIF